MNIQSKANMHVDILAAILVIILQCVVQNEKEAMFKHLWSLIFMNEKGPSSDHESE